MTRVTKNGFRPTLETMDERLLPSWGVTPPASVNFAVASDQFTVTSFGGKGEYYHTSSITRGEVDYRTFVAQRSGIYTFEAQKSGSSIDTVAALYTAGGSRLAFNDDAPGTTNSRFYASLAAGQTYVLGVTNYNGRPGGAYRAVITPPAVSGSNLFSRNGVGTRADATLAGSQLTVNLRATNNTYSVVSTHRVNVTIVDLSGRAIHTGSWSIAVVSGGQFVLGVPSYPTRAHTFDLSGFDLSRASRVIVNVSQS